MKYHRHAARLAWEALRDVMQNTRRPGSSPPNPTDVDKIITATRAAVVAEIELAKVECANERAAAALEIAAARRDAIAEITLEHKIDYNPRR